MLNIKEVPCQKDFINLPFTLYKGSPFYVPELKRETKKLLEDNPFWLHSKRQLFVAYRANVPVGRIAAIINDNHNTHWQEKTGFFGFFECEDNKETAKALFDAAAAWLKARGMDSMRGPMNPSTNHTCGVLLDNFDKNPFIMMPYNPPYYDEIIKNAGLEKVKDLVAFERTAQNDFSPRMKKIIERVLNNPSVKLRQINTKKLTEEVKIIRSIYNAAWAENWGFVPITQEEIDDMAEQLKPIIRPELTCVAEIDGSPAAFAISVPNVNHVLKVLNGSINPLKLPAALFKFLTIKDCRMIMLGVHPDHRKRGLELLLINNIVREGIEKGWKKAELSWMLEDNRAIISVIEEAGCYKTKTYRIYQKPL